MARAHAGTRHGVRRHVHIAQMQITRAPAATTNQKQTLDDGAHGNKCPVPCPHRTNRSNPSHKHMAEQTPIATTNPTPLKPLAEIHSLRFENALLDVVACSPVSKPGGDTPVRLCFVVQITRPGKTMRLVKSLHKFPSNLCVVRTISMLDTVTLRPGNIRA